MYPIVKDWPSNASKKVYVATSRAAELESPPPTGTDVVISASKAHIFPKSQICNIFNLSWRDCSMFYYDNL